MIGAGEFDAVDWLGFFKLVTLQVSYRAFRLLQAYSLKLIACNVTKMEHVLRFLEDFDHSAVLKQKDVSYFLKKYFFWQKVWKRVLVKNVGFILSLNIF